MKTAGYSRMILAALLLLPAQVFAAGWGFTPTANDWKTWPQHCRVQYSWVNRGTNMYGDYYSEAAIGSWRLRVGDATFFTMHHYCAALIYLRQAKLETNKRERDFLISKAVDDGAFTYDRSTESSILFPNVAIVYAEAKYRSNARDDAFAILQRVISAQPLRSEAYISLSNFYREEHQNEMARKVLQSGKDATNGQAAELVYALGLLCLDVADNECAIQNARQAYGLGYPLPGLRDRLTRLGKWTDK
jgi:tetratricopeptide (TPR) repeat protein